MYCRKCKKQLEKNAKFCRYCGAEQWGEDKTAEKGSKDRKQAEILPEKRKKRGMILAVFVLMAAIGTVVFFFTQSKKNYEAEPKTVLHTTGDNSIAKLETQFVEKIIFVKEEQKKEEEAHADDILHKSNKILLTEQELTELSAEQLRLARNEIYARHGYIFQDETLKTYFGGKSWYKAERESIEDSQLNEYERANLDLILAVEEKRNGWKAAYKDFLENSPEMLELRKQFEGRTNSAEADTGSAWGGEKWGFELVYLDNDEIPELVFSCPYDWSNCSILCWHDGKINSYLEFDTDLSWAIYLEREGLVLLRLSNSGGLSYGERVYQVINGELKERYGGYVAGINPDTNEYYENPPYTWEDLETGTKLEGEGDEEFYNEVNKVFDLTRAKEFSCNLSLAELYQILDAK